MKYSKLTLMILNDENAVGHKAFSKFYSDLIAVYNYQSSIFYSDGVFQIEISGVLDEDEVKRCIDDLRKNMGVSITDVTLSGNLSKKI